MSFAVPPSRPRTHPTSETTTKPEIEQPISEGENQTASDSNDAPPPSSSSENVPFKSKYTVPAWAGKPKHKFSLEVLKNGQIVETLDVSTKDHYIMGRVETCDILMEHTSISREHAVLQFRESGEAYVIDLGSANGSRINKRQLKPNVYAEVHVGFVFQFGQSTRSYIFQGPVELMNPEKQRADAEGEQEHQSKVRQLEEAAFRRKQVEKARVLAALTQRENDGASWGFGEDAEEDSEEENQSEYTDILVQACQLREQDKLTEKQLALLERLENKHRKIERIKADNKKIRVKEDTVELTSGQTTQLARNEERIQQLEVVCATTAENLQTLILKHLKNGAEDADVAALTKKLRPKKKAASDDDSENDDFYDRTGVKRKRGVVQDKSRTAAKSSGKQGVKTYKSLLEEREGMFSERQKLQQEISDLLAQREQLEAESGGGDSVDNYMIEIQKEAILIKKKKVETTLVELHGKLEENEKLILLVKPAHEPLLDFAAFAMAAAPPPGPLSPPPVAKPQQKSRKHPRVDVKPHLKEEEKPEQLGENADVVIVKEGEALPITTISHPHSPSHKSTDADVPVEESALGHSTWINESRGGLQRAPQRPKDETSGKSKPKRRMIGAQLPSDIAGGETDYQMMDGGDPEHEGDFDWKPPEGQTGDGRTKLNDVLGY